jgi:hypothetical protein
LSSKVETSSPTRVVSPELVLVDEELAAWARLRLREDLVASEAALRNSEAARIAVSTHAESVESGGPTVASWQPTARRRVPRAVYVVAVAALLAALTAYLRASTHSSSRRASVGAVAPGASSIAFAWPPVPQARYYTFSLFRGPTTIFNARQAGRERLVLPRSWAYGGRRFRLVGGVYHWRVLAFFGKRGARPPKLVVAAPLVVKPRP